EGLTILIDGGVNRPGRYELIAGKDFEELLALAGGFSPNFTRELPITVVRRHEDGRSEKQSLPAPAAGRAVPPFAFQAGDIIQVPTIAELQKMVLVLGAITGATPADEATSLKRLPYAEGDTVR